ncbi:hypothetical protein GIB67_026294 [Kingdonia uniflora]|uniref:PGG domain-containing protein n=1 Tax=Kingdonia uniflora TaxID=39325 RepID=A0A7J7LA54_9MAGN|nr:hypothetical protein GIB67_026294 [Kingdonia uniflora]
MAKKKKHRKQKNQANLNPSAASSSREHKDIDTEEPAGHGVLPNPSLHSENKKKGKEKEVLPVLTEEKKKKDLTQYQPLYRAALKGDWRSARHFFDLHSDAVTAEITSTSATALHVAVGAGHATPFVEKLVELMPLEALTLRDNDGRTALCFAGISGNTKAAEILVRKNPDLPNLHNHWRQIPLGYAAKYGHKETLLYLLSVTNNSLFSGMYGVWFLNHLIVTGFHDVALHLVEQHPGLASYREQKKDDPKCKAKVNDGNGDDDELSSLTPLYCLAARPSAFASGTHLTFWQQLFYAYIHVEIKNSNILPITHGILDPNPNSLHVFNWHQFLQGIKLKIDAITQLVPWIKRIHDRKLKHMQTLQPVKCICAELKGLDNTMMSLVKEEILEAARSGTYEVVRECLQSLPYSIWLTDDDGRNVLHLAILHRQVKVFNLIYQISSFKNFILVHTDKSDNNLFHLAGRLAPPPQLNFVSGAVLQMQRELQWFKEVEKHIQPYYRIKKNKDAKQPKEVFTEEHGDLVKEGEVWMKDTSTSCMVVATLIATIMFTAAFTVPGGNNSDQGVPIFLQASSFMIFVISDAVGFFFSITSVLMFLSILTSRYAEEDFLYSLPKRLIIGLTTLFISIASMMIAYGATLFIVLSTKITWIVAPVTLLSCVPLGLFGLLPFLLLLELILNTYGPSIFHKQSEDIIH